MNRNTLSTGASLTGVALLAACACGAGSGAIKTMNMTGMQTPDIVVFGASCGTDHSAQPLFIGAGALLIVVGMALRSFPAAILALIGAAALMVGSFTSGPSTMNLSMATSADTQMLGYGAYIVASIFLIAAFLKAFATPKPLAAGTAMAGMALATGCSCCMVTGAVTALISGAGMTGIYNQPYVFFAGGLLAAAGLWKIGGIKPMLLVVTGILITYFGPKLLELALPELMISGVNFRYIPGYLVYFLGAAIMLGGFAVAYRIAQRSYVEEPSRPVFTESVPATGN